MYRPVVILVSSYVPQFGANYEGIGRAYSFGQARFVFQEICDEANSGSQFRVSGNSIGIYPLYCL